MAINRKREGKWERRNSSGSQVYGTYLLISRVYWGKFGTYVTPTILPVIPFNHLFGVPGISEVGVSKFFC